MSTRKRIFYLLMFIWIAISLFSCLPENTQLTPSPLPFPTEIVPSATFTYPTLPPTATKIPDPVHTPTPSPSEMLGELIFEDDFTKNRGWEIGEQGIGAISLQTDRLVIAIRQANSFLYSLLTPLSLDNFHLEIELRADLCQSGDEFGLMFRVNQDFEHYRFAINCDGGARAVRILSNGSRSLVPLAEPPSIIPGPKSTNRLSIIVSGDNFRFWINGFEVFNARDITITEGALGLFVRSGRGNQATVSFDNLLIHELASISNSSSPPTP